MKNETKSTVTKQQLNEIYSRPEKKPFERLNALMDWAKHELDGIKSKLPDNRGNRMPAPHSAKMLILALFIAFIGMQGCSSLTPCPEWSEKKNGTCVEMRSNFYGTYTGYLVEDFTTFIYCNIPLTSNAGGSNKITINIDDFNIVGTLSGNSDFAILRQTLYASGEPFIFDGYGTVSGSSITLHFNLTYDGTVTAYSFTGSK